MIVPCVQVRQLEAEDEVGHMAKLIYHTSDFSVSSIVDNPKVIIQLIRQLISLL